MKKILFALSVLSLFTFISCQQPTDSTHEPAWKSFEGWGSEKAKEKYAEILGSWKSVSDNPTCGINTLVFTSDSVFINSTRYEINQNTDIIYVYNEEYDGDPFESPGIFVEDPGYYYVGFYVRINDKLLSLEKFSSYYRGSGLDVNWEPETGYVSPDVFKLDTSSSESDEGDTSSVNGTYSFSNANGTQKNGSITLSDGNWTYSGSKTNAPSGGTYTVSGSDITFSWTANGYAVSTTVTVSTSGSSVTLSSSEVVFFSTFFNSTTQSDGKYSLTFNYSE